MTASGSTRRARRLDLLVAEEELTARRERWSPPTPHPGSERGYLRLFLDTVTQADRGCDFDFMGAAARHRPFSGT